jgi:hypothetical protein
VSAGASRQAAHGRQQPRSIVVTVADAPKGQVPLGFLVLKAGVARPARTSSARPSRSCTTASARSQASGGACRRRPAEDALGQDPARHDAPHRRWRGLPNAGDNRRSGRTRRNRGGPGQNPGMAQSAAGDPPDLIGRQPARSRGCWLGIRVLGAGGFERAHLHMPARTRGSRRRLCVSCLTRQCPWHHRLAPDHAT